MGRFGATSFLPPSVRIASVLNLHGVLRDSPEVSGCNYGRGIRSSALLSGPSPSLRGGEGLGGAQRIKHSVIKWEEIH